MLPGTVVSASSGGLYVRIPALRTEYGPLSYLGDASAYYVGAPVIVGKVGPDEYVVMGVVSP